MLCALGTVVVLPQLNSSASLPPPQEAGRAPRDEPTALQDEATRLRLTLYYLQHFEAKPLMLARTGVAAAVAALRGYQHPFVAEAAAECVSRRLCPCCAVAAPGASARRALQLGGRYCVFKVGCSLLTCFILACFSLAPPF